MEGMAAMLASNARAPLTAILLMFELTRDYRIVLPLMACVGLSIWLVDRLQLATAREPVSAIEQIGLNIQSNERTVMLDHLLVQEVMLKKWMTLPAELHLLEAAARFVQAELHSAIVTDSQGIPVGILTLDDLKPCLGNAHIEAQPNHHPNDCNQVYSLCLSRRNGRHSSEPNGWARFAPTSCR